jgi:SAM-dependent methyltransferase
VVAAVERARCRLCGSGRVESAPRYGSALKRCVACGLVFTALEAAGTRDLYEDDYYRAGYRGYFERAEQWRHEARLRLRWLLGRTRPHRLLEIGCAGGFFLAEARRAGIDACGVELSPTAAEFARTELGVPVTVEAFEDAQLPPGFDAVCAFHVLEHVEDPVELVGKAHTLLAPGGVLALEVPNIESAGARRQGSSWFALQPRYHRWHFSPTALTSHVSDAGFVIENCETLFARYYSRLGGLGGRFALDNLRDQWRATRSLRPLHPSAGDYIRLLVRKP